jgi:putative tryptophan/tyrosine transport system substrate-binding protein
VRRRKFIALIGGAAAAFPLWARGQVERLPHVAFLHPYAENDPEVVARIIAFREGLEALGWVEKSNIRIEHRYSGGDFGLIQVYARGNRDHPDRIHPRQ